jgi:hypothetical protein
MNFFKRHFEMIYWWWSLIAFISSVACMVYLIFVDMMIGFDWMPFNWLMGLTLLSTVALLFGTVYSLSENKNVALLILANSAYLPIAFIVLTVNGYGPTPFLWLFFFINLVEVAMACLRFFQLKSLKVTP